MNRLEEAVQDALTTASETPDVDTLRVRVRRHRDRRLVVAFALGTIGLLIGLGIVMSATRDHAGPVIRMEVPNQVGSTRTPVTSDRSFVGDDGRVVRATEFDLDARVPIPSSGVVHWESPVLRSARFSDATERPDISTSHGFEGGTAIDSRRGFWKQTIAYRDGGWVVSIDVTFDRIVGTPMLTIHGILLEQSQAPAP